MGRVCLPAARPSTSGGPIEITHDINRWDAVALEQRIDIVQIDADGLGAEPVGREQTAGYEIANGLLSDRCVFAGLSWADPAGVV